MSNLLINMKNIFAFRYRKFLQQVWYIFLCRRRIHLVI